MQRCWRNDAQPRICCQFRGQNGFRSIPSRKQCKFSAVRLYTSVTWGKIVRRLLDTGRKLSKYLFQLACVLIIAIRLFSRIKQGLLVRLLFFPFMVHQGHFALLSCFRPILNPRDFKNSEVAPPSAMIPPIALNRVDLPALIPDNPITWLSGWKFWNPMIYEYNGRQNQSAR